MSSFITGLFKLLKSLLTGFGDVMSEVSHEIDVRHQAKYYHGDLLSLLHEMVDNHQSIRYISLDWIDKANSVFICYSYGRDGVVFDYNEYCFKLKPKDNNWCIVSLFNNITAKQLSEMESIKENYNNIRKQRREIRK